MNHFISLPKYRIFTFVSSSVNYLCNVFHSVETKAVFIYLKDTALLLLLYNHNYFRFFILFQ